MILHHVRDHSAAPFARETATVARQVTRFPVPVPLHVFAQDRSSVAFPVANHAQDFTLRIFLRRASVLLPHVDSQRAHLAATKIARRAIVSPPRFLTRRSSLRPVTTTVAPTFSTKPAEIPLVGDLVSV